MRAISLILQVMETLLNTEKGQIKLVDINNIIRIEENDTISLDDKLYTSCDK